MVSPLAADLHRHHTSCVFLLEAASGHTMVLLLLVLPKFLQFHPTQRGELPSMVDSDVICNYLLGYLDSFFWCFSI